MALSAGTRIGPYEVIALLGAGGMGDVYKARDTRLNRIVAIKALQTSVSADPERIARFEREAQILASLNHPNIAGIYGLESAGEHAYLILEFVDGRALDAILRMDGAFAPPDAVALARQIADAIAAAHEKGIIHRDLKPGNVMVTADGHVKVLDFGLGKSIDDGRPAPGESATSNSPTVTLGATQAGIVLGTAGYMSPEQAKGRAADRRSDVWSFGCMLFEMLAGSRAFDGEDITDTIAAIVRGEPNWQALPAPTPPALRQLIERTLIKDKTQRLPDMSVVRYILNEPAILGSAGPVTPVGQTTAVTAAGVPSGYSAPIRTTLKSLIFWLVIVAAAFGIYQYSSSQMPRAPGVAASHFTIVLPEGLEVVNTNMAPLAISPDGRTVAFPGRKAGRTQLYVYDVSTGETRALDGTDDARSPFFKPDGRWIGYFGRRKLRKITIGGTSPDELADAEDGRGASWSTDDIIYYAPNNATGLWSVPASGGGTASQLTKPDPAASEISHRNPYALPGGKALLFMVWTGPGADEHRIEYLSIADGTRQVVARKADGPVDIVGGRLVYAGRQDTVVSVPWNASRPAEQSAEPVALPFLAQLDNEGAAAFAASDDGTFVRLMGHTNRRLARVVWVDRTGKTEPIGTPERDYVSATISPDGTRAALHNRGGTEEIWIYDFTSKSFTPLSTPGGSSQAPVWTTDSKYIVYRGTRQGYRNIFRKAADGTGVEERLTTKGGVIQTPTSATPDGKWIVFLESGAGASGDLLQVALAGAHEIRPLIATPASEIAGQASPDGRWIAVESSASGRAEIWVQPLGPDGRATGAMVPISRDGGNAPRWSRDGRELFFMTPDGIMGVTVNGNSFSQPRSIVSGRFRVSANANSNYDVAKDGRFLHVLPIELTKPQTRIEVMLTGISK